MKTNIISPAYKYSNNFSFKASIDNTRNDIFKRSAEIKRDILTHQKESEMICEYSTAILQDAGNIQEDFQEKLAEIQKIIKSTNKRRTKTALLPNGNRAVLHSQNINIPELTIYSPSGTPVLNIQTKTGIYDGDFCPIGIITEFNQDKETENRYYYEILTGKLWQYYKNFKQEDKKSYSSDYYLFDKNGNLQSYKRNLCAFSGFDCSYDCNFEFENNQLKNYTQGQRPHRSYNSIDRFISYKAPREIYKYVNNIEDRKKGENIANSVIVYEDNGITFYQKQNSAIGNEIQIAEQFAFSNGRFANYQKEISYNDKPYSYTSDASIDF